jgi:hypothetical protein
VYSKIKEKVMLKKLNFIILILFLITVANMLADDGSWSKSFTINSGSIYSESDNTDIELTKEILIFDGKYTKAVFQFRNTSDKSVIVDCGFPVRYEINAFMINNQLVISADAYGDGEDIFVLDYFETLPLEYDESEGELFGVYPEVIPITKFNNSRNFISEEEDLQDFTLLIKQNDKIIPVQKVLLERHADENGAWATFHYKHNLNFKPGEFSTVVVEYHQDLFHGSTGMSNMYLWNYVIGTGGTWKGPIGELILIKPSEWRGSIDGLDTFWENRQISILRSVDYEPSRDIVYSLRGFSVDMMEQYEYFENKLPALKKIWTERSKLVIQPSEAVQDFVTDIAASSFLPDKLPVFTIDGVISNANFSPIAAFDGLTETSWCENIKGDGIDQYLEFSLTKRVWGIGINNGFTRLPIKDWLFESDRMEKIPFEEIVRDDSKGFKDYFTQNNRIKKLSITNQAGDILYTLNLNDQRDPQAFFGISLSPGTYRLVIEDVYRGTKWQDTCLGEVTFISAEINPQLSNFTEDPFYMDALKDVSFK